MRVGTYSLVNNLNDKFQKYETYKYLVEEKILLEDIIPYMPYRDLKKRKSQEIFAQNQYECKGKMKLLVNIDSLFLFFFFEKRKTK